MQLVCILGGRITERGFDVFLTVIALPYVISTVVEKSKEMVTKTY